jgi:ABC-2 type transport system ATP-binding protein
MLIIDHLDKHYKGTDKGVTDISIHVEPGDIYAFIGHNGAGKTTLLKAITGIHEFDKGSVTIDGINLKEDPQEVKRRIAYIPDNPDIYEFLTGIQYLQMIADVFHVSAADREARIAKYAERFEITGALGDLISSYSHGMKQKLAVVATWLHRPRLILMDEPFVGLDPMASRLLKDMMREVCNEGGAIFFSTHVLEVAEKLCDKIAIIRQGKLVRAGTMDEVRGDESLEEVFLELEAEK